MSSTTTDDDEMNPLSRCDVHWWNIKKRRWEGMKVSFFWMKIIYLLHGELACKAFELDKCRKWLNSAQFSQHSIPAANSARKLMHANTCCQITWEYPIRKQTSPVHNARNVSITWKSWKRTSMCIYLVRANSRRLVPIVIKNSPNLSMCKLIFDPYISSRDLFYAMIVAKTSQRRVHSRSIRSFTRTRRPISADFGETSTFRLFTCCVFFIIAKCSLLQQW